VDYFGVATLSEAIELREAGIKTPILVLAEPTEWDRLQPIIYYDITLMVYTEEFLDTLIEFLKSFKKKTKVHLKIDTGMSRLGVEPSNIQSLVDKIIANPLIELEGLATHLADSDNHDVSYTKKQLKIFDDVIFNLSKQGIQVPIKHVSNSAGTLNSVKPFYDMVRVGVDLYRGIMSFTAKVLYVRDINEQDAVGYGLTYKANDNQRIAVISVGYADGYSRALSNKGEVILNGEVCSVVGNVCMDMIMVAIPDGLEVNIGDDAILIGDDNGKIITTQDIADKTNTIDYEVMTSIGKRVTRIYKS